MEKISGYARVLARTRAQQEQNKPLLGKAFLKYGQCFSMAGYFFQLGSVLASKHRGNLDAFGHTFLGMHGEPGAVFKYFSSAIEDQLSLISEPMGFIDYIVAEQKRRFDFEGDSLQFFERHAMLKVPVDTAAEMAWQFAEQGAILGSIHPGIAKALFDHTHGGRDNESWECARRAGLDLPPTQGTMSWEEVEEGENEVFVEYVRQCCPSYHSVYLA